MVHDLDKPMLSNGIEKLFGFRLTGGICVANVVARFLTYLLAIQPLALTVDFNAGIHAGLAPPNRQRVGLQAVTGVAALVETPARAAPRAHVRARRSAHKRPY